MTTLIMKERTWRLAYNIMTVCVSQSVKKLSIFHIYSVIFVLYIFPFSFLFFFNTIENEQTCSTLIFIILRFGARAMGDENASGCRF